MNLQDLDSDTRFAMQNELEKDIGTSRLYLSPRLNGRGIRRWSAILSGAIEQGTPASLADSIRSEGLLSDREVSHRSGKSFEKRVPTNAADTLAEGEFIRYYMRGVCIRAISTGVGVSVYRAKSVANPRQDSDVMIGRAVDPEALLVDLRNSIGIETMLGLPPGPNSGLCIRLQ